MGVSIYRSWYHNHGFLHVDDRGIVCVEPSAEPGLLETQMVIASFMDGLSWLGRRAAVFDWGRRLDLSRSAY